ncbi:MAG TPA: hypothetical protein VFT45_10990 [Longimicrobium sp.]|nr:hypothetical protein [Longimicrobium sp.]
MMRIRRLRATLLGCAMLLAAPCAADAQAAVEPGTRVRILAPSAADTLITGTLVAIDSGSLLLAAEFDTAGVHVPLSAIRRLEVSAGPRWAGAGGLLGLLVGGAAGYVLFSGCGYAEACTDTRTIGTAGGAVAGMLLGNVIGRNAGRNSWRTVPVPSHAGP